MSAAAISVPEFKQKPKKLPLPVKLGVGAVAGAFGTSCIFPIDTVKTRLQSAPSGVNPFTVMKNIMKAEGVAGYYNGLAANLIGVIPEKAIKLAANEMFREYLENEDGSISVFNEILAGGGAGICQVVATNPMEITKIRMQMQATLPLAERQSTVQVVQTLGIRGMYQGTAATLTRDVPFSVLFFPSYANLKKAFADHRGENSTFSLLAAGGIAGALAAAVVTPTDVVKTR
jgi:solute carrier family 25 aspartate/glutamate transporter 12/13